MRTTYSCSRTFGNPTYSNSGFSSREEALENVYRRAYEAGDWKPRELRKYWWQFWLPTEHNEIEVLFVDAGTKTVAAQKEGE